MYYEHFGLSGPPFEFNPSASVLFMSAGHREGLAALEWGLREPSGFTMLVGEIGTGKTTLIYSLLATRHQGVRRAWVANPRLSFEEMLRQILGQLGADQPETAGKLALLQAFDFQLASLKPDECIAVIIDEAQDLSDDALEDLRLLSNFQSLERRRLQIVLVGQIDLARRLAGPQLRQLNQRIGARALLPILQGREIRDYVEYRLRSRGGEIERLFARGAMGELARSSGGIPRRINVLCHNALMLAYADGEERVTPNHIRAAVLDYDHLLESRASTPAKMAASASEAMQSASDSMRSAAARIAQAATPAPSTRRTIRSAAAGAFAAVCLLAILGAGFFKLRPVLTARLASIDQRPLSQILAEWTPTAFKIRSIQETTPAPKIAAAPLNLHDGSAGSANEVIILGPAGAPSTNDRLVPQQRKPVESAAANMPVKQASAGNDDTSAPTAATVIVGVGDTLSKIATRLYGGFGTNEISRLTAANPQIKNVNLIYPGQAIHVKNANQTRQMNTERQYQ